MGIYALNCPDWTISTLIWPKIPLLSIFSLTYLYSSPSLQRTLWPADTCHGRTFFPCTNYFLILFNLWWTDTSLTRTGTVPEGTLSLYSADRRHIKFIYFEKNFKKRNFRKSTGSSLRDFESRCDKSRDNWDFVGWFHLSQSGCPLGRM